MKVRLEVSRLGLLAKLLVLFVFAWPLIAWGLARFLIVRAEVPHADALVILSGSATYYERSKKAAELWKSGRAPIIILTNDNQQGGWSSAEQRNPYFYEHTTAELRKAGVPPEQIVLLPEVVAGTEEEAQLLRQYALKQNLHSFIIVTSAYHSRRALWTFRHAFQDTGIIIGLEPVPTGQQTPSPASWWIHRRGWSLVPSEYVKAVYYWIGS